MEAGATKEEITEALRVAQYLSGVGCVYTAAQALGDYLARKSSIEENLQFSLNRTR